MIELTSADAENKLEVSSWICAKYENLLFWSCNGASRRLYQIEEKIKLDKNYPSHRHQASA
jgi:hypothetical protein